MRRSPDAGDLCPIPPLRKAPSGRAWSAAAGACRSSAAARSCGRRLDLQRLEALGLGHHLGFEASDEGVVGAGGEPRLRPSARHGRPSWPGGCRAPCRAGRSPWPGRRSSPAARPRQILAMATRLIGVASSTPLRNAHSQSRASCSSAAVRKCSPGMYMTTIIGGIAELLPVILAAELLGVARIDAACFCRSGRRGGLVYLLAGCQKAFSEHLASMISLRPPGSRTITSGRSRPLAVVDARPRAGSRHKAKAGLLEHVLQALLAPAAARLGARAQRVDEPGGLVADLARGRRGASCTASRSAS